MAAIHPGASIERAEASKKRVYKELVNSDRLRLVTVAAEVGGRFSHLSIELVDSMDVARARTELEFLRSAAARAWRDRWICMLSTAIQNALCATLIDEGSGILDGFDGPAPTSVEVCTGFACTAPCEPGVPAPGDPTPRGEPQPSGTDGLG